MSQDGESGLLSSAVSSAASVLARTPRLRSAFSVDPRTEDTVTDSNVLEFVEPGDIILSQSGGPLYSLVRTMTGQKYDHCAVVLKGGQKALHVSPPTVRTLPVSHFFGYRSHNTNTVTPLVLRPRFSNNNHKNEFLLQCESLIGKDYDFVRLIDLVLRMTALTWFDLLIPFDSSELKEYLDSSNVSEGNSTAKRTRVICTEALLSLVNSSVSSKSENEEKDDNSKQQSVWLSLFEHSLLKERLDLQKVGSVTFSDIETVSKMRPDLLVRVSLPHSLRMNENMTSEKEMSAVNESESGLQMGLDLAKGVECVYYPKVGISLSVLL